MKNNTHKNLLVAIAFGAAILSGLTVQAQYPTASLLLSNSMELHSINSTEDFLYIEQSIITLGAKLRDAHQKYPHLKYAPAYHEGEIIAFMITGVPETSVADQLSSDLVQLEVLGNTVRTMNEAYLPHIKNNRLYRVSKKDASR